MSTPTFKALVVDQVDDRQVASMRDIGIFDLPAGNALIAVDCSSLNYKDALAVTGKGKIIRTFPMVPGIDLAGTVLECADPSFEPGDRVLLTGWGVGENHWGGFAQIARVNSDWLLPLPGSLTFHQAMALGTAGLTAMLCVLALEDHGVEPESGEMLVTGAGGGVGGFAVAILAQLKYQVVAVSGRPELSEYLRGLGATRVVTRDEVKGDPAKPLANARWSGAIDTAGGELLAGVLSGVGYGGCVAACGMAAGSALNTSVFPFILRGVSLIGIESVMCPPERRRVAWKRLGVDLPDAKTEAMMQIAPLAQVPRLSEEMLQGRVRGRIVVDVNS